MSEDMSLAIAALQSGRLNEAASACIRVLQGNPRHAGALHLLGVVRSSAGQHGAGAELMREAVSLAPDIVEFRKNLVKALMRLGRLQEAETTLAAAPGDLLESPDLLAMWGAIVGLQGRLDEGIAALRQAITASPGMASFHFNLAELYRRSGKRADAIASLQQTLRLSPNHADALNNLAGLQLADGRFLDAMRTIQQLLKVNPRSSQAFSNLGILLGAAGDAKSAVSALRNALTLDPSSARVKYQLAGMLVHEGDLREAESLISDLRSSEGDHSAAFKTTHARILERKGDIQGALTLIESIEAEHQGDVDVSVMRAILLEQLNRKSEAIEILQRALSSDELAALDGIGIYFALGSLLDGVGRYDEAFAAFYRGNENRKRAFIPIEGQVKNSPSGIRDVMALHDPDRYRRLPISTLDSEVPIFIVGMPRSGTSLTEQILASHSQVFGAGELTNFSDIVRETFRPAQPPEALLAINESDPSAGRHCMVPKDWDTISARGLTEIGQKYLASVRALDTKAARITDKMPYNFFLVPVIAKVFPHARIIHCRRHPLDTCLSCYFVNFTMGSQFAFDLRELGVFYREYTEMMDKWREVLEIPMFEIDYEELVSDPETQAQRLIAYCGLEWEPRCLEFHRSGRVISTASYQQVRKPLYTRSVNRWRHYDQHLGPLIEALGPLSGQGAHHELVDQK